MHAIIYSTTTVFCVFVCFFAFVFFFVIFRASSQTHVEPVDVTSKLPIWLSLKIRKNTVGFNGNRFHYWTYFLIIFPTKKQMEAEASLLGSLCEAHHGGADSGPLLGGAHGDEPSRAPQASRATARLARVDRSTRAGSGAR